MRIGLLILLTGSLGVLFFPIANARAAEHGSEVLSSLPIAQQSSISSALGRDIPSYHARPRGSNFQFQNALEDTEAEFGRDGIALHSAAGHCRMRLRAYGYGVKLRVASQASPQAVGNRVEYDRDGLTEAYVNGPAGLEQGIIFDKPPGPASGGPLTLAFDFSGELMSAANGATQFGRPRWSATDANGRNLESRAEIYGDQLLVKVNDSHAQYPVSISYWAQVSKLRSSNAYAYHFGSTVAISGDVVVVGAPYGYLADVFVKPKGQWSANMIEAAQLNPPVHTECNLFGSAVAISGNTIVVGDPKDFCSSTPPGTAYVFVEPSGGWSGSLTPTAALTASDGVGFNALGSSVWIDDDTIVAGAPATYLTGGMGAAYVFVKSTKQWINSTETAKLTSTDGSGNDQLGNSVAMNASTIVVGEPGGPVDGAYIYVEPAGGWANMTQTAKLTASDGPNQSLGYAVAIRGNTIVAGAPYATIGQNQYTGAAYVFVEPSEGWVNLTQTAKLTASTGAYNQLFGTSVAMDGNVVVAGAPNYSGLYFLVSGGAFVFVKPAGGWVNATQSAVLTGSDARSSAFFGTSVQIQGSTMVAGAAFNKRLFDGAAYIFGNFQY